MYVLCAWCVHSYLCVSLVHNNMCVSKSDTAHLMYTHVNYLLYPAHGLPVGVCLLECISCTKRAHCSLMYMLLCPIHHQIGGEECCLLISCVVGSLACVINPSPNVSPLHLSTLSPHPPTSLSHLALHLIISTRLTQPQPPCHHTLPPQEALMVHNPESTCVG